MMADQAAGLRSRQTQSTLQTLAVPLCAGDPYATAWAAQVALACQQTGLRTLVLDASGGRVAQTLGLPRIRRDLVDLLTGAATFTEVAGVTSHGAHVVIADRGLEAFVASGNAPASLLQAFASLSHGFNVMVLVMPVNELASVMHPDTSVPVVVADPTASGIQRAYGAMKRLSTEFGFVRFAVALHGTAGPSEADATYSRLSNAAQRFLNAGVSLAGWIPDRSSGTIARTALDLMVQSLLQQAATPVLRH